ncbi:MAG: CDP-diacylglycerol--serine O-phosphatidyltransferase [Bacteroidetes bacterium]|nr:CDP-diacylglycerol--serine O-phosphatidyltransferase [Bacteroidota bacterium]
MNPIKHLPNVLTLSNLAIGAVGIISLLQIPNTSAIWFVGICCVFDFLDGFSARLLKVTSPIGKELDSLADVISFGLLPGVFMFQQLGGLNQLPLAWISMLLPVFAALRLAKFNVDTRQSEGFIGLPTPAMALLITTLPFLAEKFMPTSSATSFHFAATMIVSLMMVSPLPLPAMKFSSWDWSNNKLKYIVILGSLIMVGWLGIAGIALSVLFYLLTSIFTGKN